MKTTIILAATAAAIFIAGCSKENNPPGNASTPAPAQPKANTAASPVAAPAMSAWQQGDQAGAVSNFLAADWTASPLFAADSALSLSEDQFKALSEADRQRKGNELNTQLDTLKQLAGAVAQAGDEAMGKGDAAQAKKCYTALKQCGHDLNSPNFSTIVQLVGQSFEKKANAGLAKVGQ